jgi:ankyrin repeat protein
MKLLFASLLLLFSAPLYSMNDEVSVQNFHELVKKNDVPAVSDKLLTSPFLATAQNTQKDTALHVAARSSNDQMVTLLAKGTNKEVMNGMGDTPLIIASQYGNHVAVKALLAAGALVNGCGARDGSTPLYFACWSSQLDIAKTLLQAGANPKAKNPDGHTILFAAHRGYLTYVEEDQAMINLVKSYITPNAETNDLK